MNQNPLKSIQDYLVTTTVQIPILAFVINILLAAILAYVLSRIYERYADSLSNRKLFGRNFIIITMTTMLIISIVKSSLALSLGLVGALSIVRFRAAIKEPEELAYLFLAIGIGLGLGANQTVVTVIGFIVIIMIIIVRKNWARKADDNQNLHLTIYSHNPQKVELEQILETLKRHCTAVDLKRFDETENELEACFFIEFSNIESLNNTKNALQQLSDSIKISFLDNKGII